MSPKGILGGIMDRRDFLKTATTAVGIATTEQLLTPMLRAEGKTPESDVMIYRTLGRTGERISSIGLGGYHIGKPSLQEQESIQLVRRAADARCGLTPDYAALQGNRVKIQAAMRLARKSSSQAATLRLRRME